jgi:WD40 repeat protein
MAAVSPDGRTLAAAQFQGPMFLWDLTTGKAVPDAGGRPEGVRSVAFDPTVPTALAVATTLGEIVFFDTAANAAIGQPLRVHGNAMRDVAFDASGHSMAAFADDQRISLWGNSSAPGLIDAPFVDDSDLNGAAFSPDDVHVALFGQSGAELRRADDPQAPGMVLTQPGASDAEYWDANFSGDGSRVLLNSGTDGVPSLVADTATGATVWTHDDIPRDLNPDGTLAVIDRDSSVVDLWNVDTNELVASTTLADVGIDGHFDSFLQFSPDGSSVDFIASGYAVRLSVPALELVSKVESGRAQCSEAHMPQSGYLVSMDGAGRVTQFDLTAGKVAATGVSRDSSSICGVGVSQDGSMLAAHQSFTQHLSLFDGATMKPVGTPIPIGERWMTPAFRDRTHIVERAASGGLAMYDLNPDHWQEYVCAQVGRNLTAAEWTEYLGADEPYRATCPQWPADGSPVS